MIALGIVAAVFALLGVTVEIIGLAIIFARLGKMWRRRWPNVSLRPRWDQLLHKIGLRRTGASYAVSALGFIPDLTPEPAQPKLMRRRMRRVEAELRDVKDQVRALRRRETKRAFDREVSGEEREQEAARESLGVAPFLILLGAVMQAIGAVCGLIVAVAAAIPTH